MLCLWLQRLYVGKGIATGGWLGLVMFLVFVVFVVLVLGGYIWVESSSGGGGGKTLALPVAV